MADESVVLAGLRLLLLAVLVVGLLGTDVDLFLLAHYEDPLQFTPFFIIAVCLVAAGWHAVSAGERYLHSSSFSDDPLASHGGTGDNLFLRWNGLDSELESIDVVVHFHGYSGSSATSAMLRPLQGSTGEKLSQGSVGMAIANALIVRPGAVKSAAAASGMAPVAASAPVANSSESPGRNGVTTMKMISKTNMISTIGVTLISD